MVQVVQVDGAGVGGWWMVGVIILINMSIARYGKYHDLYAVWKANPKNSLDSYRNNITRRNQ